MEPVASSNPLFPQEDERKIDEKREVPSFGMNHRAIAVDLVDEMHKMLSEQKPSFQIPPQNTRQIMGPYTVEYTWPRSNPPISHVFSIQLCVLNGTTTDMVLSFHGDDGLAAAILSLLEQYDYYEARRIFDHGRYDIVDMKNSNRSVTFGIALTGPFVNYEGNILSEKQAKAVDRDEDDFERCRAFSA